MLTALLIAIRCPAQDYGAWEFDGTNDIINVAVTATNSISFWAQEGGTWHHYVDVNGTKYRDAASYSWTNIFYNNTGSAYEWGYDGSSYYDGPLASPRIYNRALSAAEIDDLYRMGNGIAQDQEVVRPVGTAWMLPDTNNLVSYWRPGITGDATDYYASFDGALSNGALATASTGFDLTATTNAYVEIPDDDAFSFGDGSSDDPFSLSCWYRLDTAGVNSPLITRWLDTGSLYEWYLVHQAADNIRFQLVDRSVSAGLIKISTETYTETNVWRHLAATYDGSGSSNGLSLYVNGSAVSVTDLSNPSYVAMENIAMPTSIGRFETSGGFDYTDGTIDEVLIYTNALTADEVWQLYTSTARKYAPMNVPNDPLYGDAWTDAGGTNHAGSLVYHGYSKASWGDVITNTFDFSTYGNSGTASNGTTVSSSGNPLKVYESSQTGGWTPIQ